MAFYILPTQINLPTDVKDLIRDIRAVCPNPSAVVLDTLNRSFDGSENSDEDMGRYIKSCGEIEEAFRCAVVPIHHAGHSKDIRPRGHSSLMAAADTQIRVSAEKEINAVTAIIEFMKDGEEGKEINSSVDVVEVGTDDDGDPVTTCVLSPFSTLNRPIAATPAKSDTTGVKGIVMRALATAIENSGIPAPPDLTLPEDTQVVPLAAWRTAAYAEGISKGGERAHQQAFDRASRSLLKHKRLGMNGAYAWLLPEANR